MFGHGEDTGILRKSVEFLLNKSASKLAFEFIEIHGDKVFDCSTQTKIDISRTPSNASKATIESLEQFDEILKISLRNRVQRATNQNITSSRSHAIIKICVQNAVLLFADLAGFESQQGKDKSESKFINSSLLEVNKMLLCAFVRGKDPICTTTLTRFFKTYIASDIVMLFHAPASSSQMIKNALNHVKEFAVVLKSAPPNQTPKQALKPSNIAINKFK